MAKLTVSASPTDTNTNILLVSSSSGAVNLAYDKTGKLTLSQGSIINNYNTALAGASHTADANLIQGNFSASSGDTIFNAYGVTGIINGYTGGTHVSTLLNSAGGYFKNDIQSTDFTAASGVVIAPATVAGASGSNYYNLQAGRVTLSSGTIITSTYGLYNNGVFADTGSRNTNAYGIYSGGALVQSGGAITNNYGAYIASPQSIGSLPRSYGLYIADQSPSTVGASSSYAIYSNGGTSYFKGDIGIGSTSPFAKLSISANANDTYNPNLFLISSSTNGTATTSVLTVLANGNVGVGTSTPGTIFSIGDAGANTINISNTSTSTFATGINIKSGCFAVNGNCISGSGSGNIVDTLSATLGAGNDAGGQNIVNVGKIGVGSTSPWAQLSVEGTSTLGNQAIAGYFAATSTTATSTFAGGLYVGSTSPSLVVSSNSGKVSVGTTTDLEKLTIEGNITPSMTNTFTAGSFNLTNMTAASAAVTLSGIADNDRSGIDVASAGDVNGDGITDYMTTALWAAGGGTRRGQVYVFFGTTTLPTSANVSSADVIISGIANNDMLYNVASAGDVNGDGYGDIILAASNAAGGGTTRGEVYVFYGGPSFSGSYTASSANLIISGIANNDSLGSDVASLGDVNGDGYSDFIIGAMSATGGGTSRGQAYVFYGGPNLSGSKVASSANVIISGNANSDRLGIHVTSAGDMNGDGYSDIAVSAYGAAGGGTNRGEAYVFYGGPNLSGSKVASSANVIISGVQNSANMANIASAGDVNGDGYDDLVLGSNSNSGGGLSRGQAYIFYGKSTLAGSYVASSANVVISGILDSDTFGSYVSSLGDLNGDGYSDVMISAVGAIGSDFRGQAYVFYGKPNMTASTTAASADVTITGSSTGDDLGNAFSAGDFNNDGYPDIIVGAYTAAGGGTIRGQTYIFTPSGNRFKSIYSLKPSTLSRYAAVCGCPINTSLRRSLGSTRQNPPSGPGHMPPNLKSTITHAEVCATLRRLETRVTFLETQLGIQPPSQE
jgi:hypothetical protein